MIALRCQGGHFCIERDVRRTRYEEDNGEDCEETKPALKVSMILRRGRAMYSRQVDQETETPSDMLREETSDNRSYNRSHAIDSALML